MENNYKRRGRQAVCSPSLTKDGQTYYKGIMNYFGEVSTILVFKDEETGNVKVYQTKWNNSSIPAQIENPMSNE
jgi:hypothetical protein